MFSKSFKARIDGYTCAIRRQSGNNEDRRVICARLLFELDAELASEIGGPAPRIFELLSADDDSASIGAVPVSLNSKAVNVRFVFDKKLHIVSDTISLRLRIIPPTSTNVSPMLQARLAWLGGLNDVTMLWDSIGRHVGVRMDRHQLELPGMDTQPEAQGEAAQ